MHVQRDTRMARRRKRDRRRPRPGCHADVRRRRRRPTHRAARSTYESATSPSVRLGHTVASNCRSTAGRHGVSQPSTGIERIVRRRRIRAATQCRRRAHMVLSGSDAASATTAASPTDVSRALDAIAGTPLASAARSASRTPPMRCGLITIASAASSSWRRRASAVVRMQDSAATGIADARRATPQVPRATPPGPRPARCRSERGAPASCIAVSTSHAPFASRRILTLGPHAERTAATRSSGLLVADLDLDGGAAGAERERRGDVRCDAAGPSR